MSKTFRNIPESLWRITIVFGLFIAVVLIVRASLPETLKNTQLHVTATVDKETSKPQKYIGSERCAECHEQSKTKNAGNHRNLSCESCHGSGNEHAENPGEMHLRRPQGRDFCTRCHGYNSSRPTGFPQINAASHNPTAACITCHDPHNPKTPHVPQECQGCHAEIARTKSLSPHAQLECNTCHDAPNGHKVTPQTIRVSIPSERSFCGKCHALGTKRKEAPKIDLLTHGEKYLCWQCHYPHMPEAD